MLTLHRLSLRLFAIFSAAMLGLAAGAVWMLPVMFLQRPLSWLAVPVGWLLALAIRSWIMRPGIHAALLAALVTLLAALYLSILLAAVRIAGTMGISLIDSLHDAGPNMLLQLARMSWSAMDFAWFVAGATVAAMVAWKPSAEIISAR